MARPTKLTPDVAAKIVQLVKVGNYAERAAQMVGVEPRTFYRWMERGRAQRRGRYRQFCQVVRQAKAEREGRLVTIVSLGAERDPKLALEMLSRTDPKRWARRDNLNLDAKLRHDGQIRHEHERVKPDLSMLSDEELRAYQAHLIAIEDLNTKITHRSAAAQGAGFCASPAADPRVAYLGHRLLVRTHDHTRHDDANDVKTADDDTLVM